MTKLKKIVPNYKKNVNKLKKKNCDHTKNKIVTKKKTKNQNKKKSKKNCEKKEKKIVTVLKKIVTKKKSVRNIFFCNFFQSVKTYTFTMRIKKQGIYIHTTK